MQYIGSKRSVAKHILPTMLMSRGENRVWVEPFVGGANMIDKVLGNRIGNDNHPYLIALLKKLQGGWIPPTEVTREMYYSVKKTPDNYDPALVGFIGFLCSFGGKWWGGYAKNKKGDNYAARGSRVLVKQSENLKGIEFVHGSYLDMNIPPNSLIYCDPPYAGTTKYSTSTEFDHKLFWDWCRQKSKEGHIIFVSEYNAPDDFECLVELEHKTKLDKNSQYKRVERLFKYNDNSL